MSCRFYRRLVLGLLGVVFSCSAEDRIELLALPVVSYEEFVREDAGAMGRLKAALHEKGIVGIRSVPGYKEKVFRFIEAAREFSALPENVKEAYAPDRARGDLFLGYEMGKERFKRPDGKWVVDDLKVSYYAFVPDAQENRWPVEVDLRSAFLEIGTLMSEMGEAVMKKVGLLDSLTGISLDGVPRTGRMLYYKKSADTAAENPLWCGAHFDHSVFTALLPAFYFREGKAVPEPDEAGLFVKTTSEGVFQKVAADDPEVMLFQVGEFGQLATNDAIQATEHRVHKARTNIERYTMALFFDASLDAVIHSTSSLTQDSRYGAKMGEACSFRHWKEESFKRYLVKDNE